ncbi:unnamed protein product [Heterotrigona itama]|uniref:Uncharacterized protein n=1 Tax=Heterotrigona itama TaxID=395501 RepID=A0A6V7H0X4_9HYME|nr:unnamed protein product [Heterotrigona itama]
MVSSSSPGVNVSPANSVATSRVVVSDSDVARDGDAILPSTRQSYRAEDEGGHVNGAPAAVEWSQSGPPSISMSVDLHNLINPNLEDSGHYSASPEHADASALPCNVKSARNHEEEESYEAFGSVEGDADDGVESPGGSSSAPSPTGNSSLNQLYRSGSFNSSGRGSNCDPADDMYSDVSLEDDVIDLNHRMCAANTPCRSPPRSRSPTENPADDVRFHQQHPAHPPPYAYYPPPYPHLNPYSPYPYHPGGFYTPSYCSNDVPQETKGSPWFSILLLIFLLVCVISIVFYRSREIRRRLNVRLPNLVQPAQTAKRKNDAKQSYPTEFILYSDVTDPLDRDFNIVCEGCEDQSRNYSNCIWDRSRNEGIIEYSSDNKIDVATDISGTFMNEITRSVAS